MDHDHPVTWLEAVLIRAQTERWCTTPHCTTCGSMTFKMAYWSAAARQAGVRVWISPNQTPRDFLAALTSAELE